MRSLLAGIHPRLFSQFCRLVGTEPIQVEQPPPKRQLVAASDLMGRARQAGLIKLNCVDHDMLCGFRVSLATAPHAVDLDQHMKQFAQLNELDRSASLSVQLEHSDVFHASSYMQMDAAGMDIDSEEELSEEWIEDRDNLLLDQFVDVSRPDKQFMMLWNHFLRRHQHKMVFDQAMREYLWTFMEEHRDLLAGELRRAFCMHLFSCWEMGLISAVQIEAYLAHTTASSREDANPEIVEVENSVTEKPQCHSNGVMSHEHESD
eukprot:TRINITY_DN45812_c0_g1_i1.p1 TRINITY_DN45812_c0_g1~~TRINITY_DN45812_c0_g1_i1.p1  ORF type:complete len:262 (+),score=28.79 TRINITY_DN45812_c0_g1_i1:187-972(+)